MNETVYYKFFPILLVHPIFYVSYKLLTKTKNKNKKQKQKTKTKNKNKKKSKKHIKGLLKFHKKKKTRNIQNPYIKDLKTYVKLKKNSKNF